MNFWSSASVQRIASGAAPRRRLDHRRPALPAVAHRRRPPGPARAEAAALEHVLDLVAHRRTRDPADATPVMASARAAQRGSRKYSQSSTTLVSRTMRGGSPASSQATAACDAQLGDVERPCDRRVERRQRRVISARAPSSRRPAGAASASPRSPRATRASARPRRTIKSLIARGSARCSSGCARSCARRRPGRPSRATRRSRARAAGRGCG